MHEEEEEACSSLALARIQYERRLFLCQPLHTPAKNKKMDGEHFKGKPPLRGNDRMRKAQNPMHIILIIYLLNLIFSVLILNNWPAFVFRVFNVPERIGFFHSSKRTGGAISSVFSSLSLRIRDNCLVREKEGRGKTRESARSFLMSFLFRSSSFPLGPSVVEIHWERES